MKQAEKKKGGGHRTTEEIGPPGLLNVFLHGTFGSIVKYNGMNLVTPRQKDHAYYAGVPTGEFPGGLYPLGDTGTQYYLMGLSCGRSRSRFNTNTNGVLGDFEVSVKTAAFQVNLPMPYVVYSRRMSPGPNVFAGPQAHRFNGRSLALVQILTYSFHDLNQLEVYPDIDWDPKDYFDPITQTVNLHFYAESEDFMRIGAAAEHVAQAFQDLTAMFPGMEVNFVKPDTNPVPLDAHTGIPGVTPDDEKSLRELKNLKGAPQGTEPANCVGLTVEIPQD